MEWETIYNCPRPHASLKGKTPYEILLEKLQSNPTSTEVLSSTPGRRSQKICRRRSGFRQKNLRAERISLTATPSHGRSARCRWYRLCALSDRKPQDGQVDFSSLVF